MNRINLIALGVKSISKSMEFYKFIGFTCYANEKEPPVVFFDNQGTKLELYPLDELAKDIDENNPPATDRSGFPGFTLAINMKSKEEVDDFLSLAEKNNGKIVKKAQPVAWGGYSGYFQDLDGYYWEVAYSEAWKFDEQNMLIIE